jgi:hypothetical protein
VDASRIVTFLTDAAPFGTDPESVNTLSKIPELVKRAGVNQKRMSYTPAGKDGAFATIAYSPKKFHHLKDLRDNKQIWSGINDQTGNLTMMRTDQPTVPVKPVYGIIAIQKEELHSPSGSDGQALKTQHDYYIECKYTSTVLFRDPYEVESKNIPTVTSTGSAPRGRDDQMNI